MRCVSAVASSRSTCSRAALPAAFSQAVRSCAHSSSSSSARFRTASVSRVDCSSCLSVADMRRSRSSNSTSADSELSAACLASSSCSSTRFRADAVSLSCFRTCCSSPRSSAPSCRNSAHMPHPASCNETAAGSASSCDTSHRRGDCRSSTLLRSWATLSFASSACFWVAVASSSSSSARFAAIRAASRAVAASSSASATLSRSAVLSACNTAISLWRAAQR
mmetsp:Transcript_15555/g.33780  ORF Transcript_15555/g.33780 Transcript_15555/m.33780 type:complete len:222 (+) Transcript_15555:289-954(+)